MVVKAYQINANVRNDVYKVVISCMRQRLQDYEECLYGSSDNWYEHGAVEDSTIAYLTSITTHSIFNIRQNRGRRASLYKIMDRILRRPRDEC
jgi:hypothetical protein